MATRSPEWKVISLKSLAGLLDIRSRPADIPPGALRWRQNFQTSSEGKLCTRDGFSRAFADVLWDENGCKLSGGGCTGTKVFYHNNDLHHQGQTRQPITFEYESTASDGTRRLFAGTQSSIFVLDESTGYWTTIASGLGSANSYWVGACLQNVMVFGNGTNDVLQHTLGTGTTSTIPDLVSTLQVTAVNVVIEYQGFIFLMNMTQQGQRKTSRVRWSDLNNPISFDPAVLNSLAGFQDLEYGDEILAAAPMMGSLYIYTRRSIWRVQVSGASNTTWSFTRVYTEPKNQTGCLTFPRTLVSTGSDHYYLSRDSIYHFNIFMPQPEREEWTRRADGVIYKKTDTAMSGLLCNSPCGEYRAGLKELWFSWPSGNRILNNWTLVLNIEQRAADVVDHGFTAMANYRRTPNAGLCNEVQEFICASSVDFGLKDIGGVFYREFLTLTNNDPTVDLDPNAPPTLYFTTGYYRILRGVIPLGFYDRQKAVRNVLLDHDTSIQNSPCVVQLRIGNAYTLVDPNDTDNICAPQWRKFSTLPLACPSSETLTQMAAKNQKQFTATEWNLLEQNVFLYWEMTVQNADGSAAVGADSCFERIDFSARALPAR